MIGDVVTHLIADGNRFRTDNLGSILQDQQQALWVRFPDTQTSDANALAYLALDMDSFIEIARRHVVVSQTAFLPRSQQHRHAQALSDYNDWIDRNDRRCNSDEWSFWNRMHDDDA